MLFKVTLTALTYPRPMFETKLSARVRLVAKLRQSRQSLIPGNLAEMGRAHLGLSHSRVLFATHRSMGVMTLACRMILVLFLAYLPGHVFLLAHPPIE